MGVMSLEETLAEARRRKDGDFIRSVVYWLSCQSPGVLPNKKMREFSERDKVCSLCPKVSSSLKWCCCDQVNPVAIEDMTIPPDDCPYCLELVILGED